MSELENASGRPPERYDLDYWQGDSPEQHRALAPDPYEVVTAVMVVAYETLGNRSILPSATLATFASDLMVYDLGRSLKDSEDTIEAFIDRDQRPHVQAFLTQAFGVIEVAHGQGLAPRPIIAALEAKVAMLHTVEVDVSQITDASVENDRFCTRVWQTALMAEERTNEV